MALTFPTLDSLLSHGFDTVIDVRSPAEFAEDHVPGAINLPVLDNEERAEVGTIYVQQSPFLARKLGAAKVFHNAANHIAGPLAHHDGGWRPLVYCWRGGQRSGSFTWMLNQIGWRADSVDGGYRTYRRLVHDALYGPALPHRIVLIDGYTGTAKTDLLHLLTERGHQVLDLEGLANHRGSLLGGMPGGQPLQKGFESRIAGVLDPFDPEKPVIVEAESNKVGELLVPPALWAAMKAAPRIEVTAPIAARTAYLTRAYDDILSDAGRLTEKLRPLVQHRGRDVVEGWLTLLAEGDKPALTRALMEQHYDLAYAKSRKSYAPTILATIESETLDPDGLNRTADEIEKVLARY
ncbi:tRNA 2-selenouridine(34) synthase MnmH [Pelagovum pacificum]|uniref:tRNA 2-selenouridine(34) synthase MnmH n=1 Tax=Pelagovum pacificum TaxID=2588711 RepID=A0A5C5GH52_9RHOB|nr:tRNA 2-selenouridine(34) synthase MnmH [Pelagovum pacificum]QQA42947.1 tRNA 2-selenouridine(34) synthase MnmH [Pelagovum pacificum]TNY33910.1 tRNA 2-selenouridine(34) synthase MnmH [Pelagovum pacificum]